jgi:hypothetical protein
MTLHYQIMADKRFSVHFFDECPHTKCQL